MVLRPPEAGPQVEAATAVAQRPRVRGRASGREEATGKLAWPPAFSQAVHWAGPAWLRRGFGWRLAKGQLSHRLMECTVPGGAVALDLTPAR